MADNKKTVRVGDLITLLQKVDATLPVVWADEIRQTLLTTNDIRLGGGNVWIFYPNARWGMAIKDACIPLEKVKNDIT